MKRKLLCARCLKDTPATEMIKICYGDNRVELPLCTPHAAVLDAELRGWLRLGTDIPGGHAFALATQARETRMTPAAPADNGHRATPTPTVRAPADDEDEEDDDGYYLTDHARTRAIERNLSISKIRAIIRNPAITRTNYPAGENIKVFTTNDAQVVVDTREQAIITVSRRDEPIEAAVSKVRNYRVIRKPKGVRT